MYSSNNIIKLFTIEFGHKIDLKEIPKFRGAVISAMENAPIQFHNHLDDGLVYSYPLVQYKSIGGNASVLCLGETVKDIGSFLSEYHTSLRIGTEDKEFPIAKMSMADVAVGHSDCAISYAITNWLPFNQKNYERFRSLEGLSEKCSMLENILVGNILSFAKGTGIYLDFNIECTIQEMTRSRIMEFKKVKMMAFDIMFKCNVTLPEHIGLGKGVSHGFGVVKKK